MIHGVKVLECLLDCPMAHVGAVEHAAAGRARAELVERLVTRGHNLRIEGHAHIIVGTEQDRALAVADGDGRAFDLLHDQVEWVGVTCGEQVLALLDERIELGKQVGHYLSCRRCRASTNWPTVSISACMFMEMMTSKASSMSATKASTVRLSHSRSVAKRVASVTATFLRLSGSMISTTVS